MMELAAHRVPALATAGVKKLYNGPESFTPDNNFLLGAAPEVRGVFVAAGFNSGGIANAGGAGLALAEWIADGEPTRDLWSVDVARFAPFARSDAWLRRRTIETLGVHYALPWPNRELETGRGVRRSPVHHLLQQAGASFGSRLGWERANWFAGPGGSPDALYSFGRQNWHDRVAAEHQATRERVAIFDQTSFAKFVVQGPGAEDALQTLCANDIAVPPGRVVYTAMLNERGGFESDLTVTRVAEEEFLLVTGSAQQVRDLAYLKRHLPSGLATITDVTSALAVFGVMGPKSREVLSRVSDADFSARSFPFGTSRMVEIGYAHVRATRMTYVGELGWELYVPAECAVGVYETLLEAGEESGIAPAGYYAIDSLRLEKGNRMWGRDLTPDITLIEAGLTRFSKLDSDVSFRGRRALEKQLHEPLARQLIHFSVEDPSAVLWGGEVLVLGEHIVGTVTSAAFGHTMGVPVGIALVRAPEAGFEWSGCGDLWVDLGARPAKVTVLRGTR
jgi:4-methylaminobutanoate oxidase (formaldehyde-forming)